MTLTSVSRHRRYSVALFSRGLCLFSFVMIALRFVNITCLSIAVVDMEKKKALSSDLEARPTCDMSSRCPADNSFIAGADMPTSRSRLTSSSCQCSEAATALLEHYHGSTESQLIEFIATHFPSVPANHRHVLTRAALAGALFASRLHFVMERNRMSLNPEKKLMAIDAGSSLSLLNAGLRSEPLQRRELVLPEAVVSEDEDTLFVGKSPLQSYPRDYDIMTATTIEKPADGIQQQQSALIQPADHPAAAVSGENGDVQAVRPYVPTGTMSPSANLLTYELTPTADFKRTQEQPPAEPAAETRRTSTRIPMAAPQRSSYSPQQSVLTPRRHPLRTGAVATPQNVTRTPPAT